MVTIDSFRKANPRLNVLAAAMFMGLAILVAGLWWLQIVKRKDYEHSLNVQSYKTVRIPATRGSIKARKGEILAESRPNYTLNLYLEEVRPYFQPMYDQLADPLKAANKAARRQYEAQVQRDLTPEEIQRFRLSSTEIAALGRQARYTVVSNVVADIAATLQTPLQLDPEQFHQHYSIRRPIAMPILRDLNPTQLARFAEANRQWPGVEIEVQPERVYPHGKLAAHLVGYLLHNDDSVKGEVSHYDHRLPDYRGVVGIEWGYDEDLRGQAGRKIVLVNNFGYRFEDTGWEPAKRGSDVVLTIDLELQEAAEAALQKGPGITRGAIVVMDVRNGDILALASSPAYDPNSFTDGISREEIRWLNDDLLRPQINRATQDNYAPGSIFKTIIGLAALEAGVDPKAKVHVPPYPGQPHRGVIYVGSRPFRDSAGPGDYDFWEALKLSSNAYFISNGLFAGIDRIVELGERLHLGETTGLRTRQETSGIWPSQERVSSGWYSGDTANVCIGQGRMSVTPIQMAVMTAAIANGGDVLWPRLVKTIIPSDTPDNAIQQLPAPRVRDQLKVRPRNLKAVRDAMLADVEDPNGTGRAAALSSVRICGKTGTAQIKDQSNVRTGLTTWFASFAPYEAPRFAVVIMVEDGTSGGDTCAPLARDIYQVLYPEPANEVSWRH